MLTGLVKVLESYFPPVEEIGGEVFTAMARAFIVEEPPRTPMLAIYGDKFAALIAAFEPAQEIVYLADVARIVAASPGIRYPAPAVGLPPWYRFAINGLLLRYIAGGDVRPVATNGLYCSHPRLYCSEPVLSHRQPRQAFGFKTAPMHSGGLP
jgi:hypothetical protein